MSIGNLIGGMKFIAGTIFVGSFVILYHDMLASGNIIERRCVDINGDGLLDIVERTEKPWIPLFQSEFEAGHIYLAQKDSSGNQTYIKLSNYLDHYREKEEKRIFDGVDKALGSYN